jgi:hypothetical protein
MTLLTAVLVVVCGGVLAAYVLRRPSFAPGLERAFEGFGDRVVSDLASRFESLRDLDRLSARKLELEAEVAALWAEKADIEKAFAQRRRDLEHEMGLQKKEMDAALERGQKTADLEADRKVLEAERKFNDDVLQAKEAAFKEQVADLREIADRMFQLVPDMKGRIELKGDV